MDSERIDVIKDSLRKLISNLTWLISISMIVFFAKIQGLTNINIGQFTIDSGISGWFILTFLFIQLLSIIKNYDSIINNFKGLENEKSKGVARLFLNSYSNILNPFADQKDSIRSKFLDIWGYVIFSIAPLLSLFLGAHLIQINSTLEIVVFIVLLLISTWLIFEHVLSEKYAVYIICPNSEKRKRFTSVILGLTIWIMFILWVLSKKYGW